MDYSGASFGLSYFDQIEDEEEEKTGRRLRSLAQHSSLMFGCHHSHLSRSLLLHWTEKDVSNEKKGGFTAGNQINKKEAKCKQTEKI